MRYFRTFSAWRLSIYDVKRVRKYDTQFCHVHLRQIIVKKLRHPIITFTALPSGNFAGIGIMLPAPYVLIDKDAIEDAPIYDPLQRKIVSPLALRIIDQVPSYAELSPNNGLHIITEAVPKR